MSSYDYFFLLLHQHSPSSSQHSPPSSPLSTPCIIRAHARPVFDVISVFYTELPILLSLGGRPSPFRTAVCFVASSRASGGKYRLVPYYCCCCSLLHEQKQTINTTKYYNTVNSQTKARFHEFSPLWFLHSTDDAREVKLLHLIVQTAVAGYST